MVRTARAGRQVRFGLLDGGAFFSEALTDVVRAGGVHKAGGTVLDLDVHRQITSVDVIDGIPVQRDLLHRVRIAVDQLRAQGAAALPGTAEVKKHPRDHQNNSGEK